MGIFQDSAVHTGLSLNKILKPHSSLMVLSFLRVLGTAHNMRFDILTAELMKTAVFCDVTPSDRLSTFDRSKELCAS